MKTLLALSLAANVAFAAVVFLRASNTPKSSGTASATATTAAAFVPTGDKAVDALRAALASGDAAALQAAGLTAEAAHDIALGRAFGRFAEKMRNAQSSASNGQWWKRTNPGSARGLNREQLLGARRELSDAMIAAFGDDLGIGGSDFGALAFLPAAKRATLRSITQDYDEMMAKFDATGGIQLASDREKLKLLRAERDRDIAALLSPEEFADYEMRTSTTAATVRARFGDAIESEDDFRKIYALQKAFDDKFPNLTGRITPDMMNARSAATTQLQSDLRAALGEDKYAALRRATDNDLRTLDGLASRLNLPASTTDNVVASRDNYAAESQRINSDTSLTPQQRRAQLTELGSRAKSEVARALGTEGAEIYAQRSGWLGMLQGGMAFSTTPQANSPGALSLAGAGGPSVFPVMPAGVQGATGMRQMIVSDAVTVSGGGGASPGGAIFMMPAGGGGVPREGNVQVMSFTAAEMTTVAPSPGAAAPAAGTSGQVVAPPQPPKQ